MSDIAVTWAKAQVCPDRSAKQVLVSLAGYADAAGEAWAMVPVLAFECQTTDRTIQRGLRALEGAGLLKRTGRSKVYFSRRMPIYRLPLEAGQANTRDAMKALTEATGDTGVTPRAARKAAREAVDGRGGARPAAAETTGEGVSAALESGAADGARGDVDVTPDGPLGVTPVSPVDDSHVTPWGDTRVTQIGKINTQGLKPSSRARACEAACRIWATKAPERVSPARVDAAWAEAIRRTGETDERLLAAVTACVARDPDFARDRAMNLDRWLDEGRFAPWLDAADAGVIARVGWAGPDRVRAVVGDAMGAGAVASYVDGSAWDEGRQAVVTRTSIAADRLRRGAGRALKAIGVSVEYGEAAHVGG